MLAIFFFLKAYCLLKFNFFVKLLNLLVHLRDLFLIFRQLLLKLIYALQFHEFNLQYFIHVFKILRAQLVLLLIQNEIFLFHPKCFIRLENAWRYIKGLSLILLSWICVHLIDIEINLLDCDQT